MNRFRSRFAPTLVLACLGAVSASGCGSDPSEPTPSVLLLGVDGLSPQLLGAYGARGDLPNLQRLRETSTTGLLQSLVPTLSCALWTTVATGVLPERHHVREFFVKDEGSGEIRLPLSSDRAVRALWEILSERGRRATFIHWWVTWPAEPTNGLLVSDALRFLQGPNQPEHAPVLARAVHPPARLEEVLERFPGPNSVDESTFAPYVEFDEGTLESLRRVPGLRLGGPEEAGDSIFRDGVLRDRFVSETAARYYGREPADLFAFYLAHVDECEHVFWNRIDPEILEKVGRRTQAPKAYETASSRFRYKDVIGAAYRFVDRVVGEFVAKVDATPGANLVLISDHGHGPAAHANGPPGVILLHGPAFEAGRTVEGSRLQDVAPTILALLGVEVASDLDGRPLEAAFRPGYFAERPIRWVPTYETSPRNRVEGDLGGTELNRDAVERLKALGYQ